MTIGIGINVDARQVKDARKAIEDLNGAMVQTQEQPVVPGGAHLEEVSAQIKRITADINRLRTIASTGEKRGGILDKQQFTEVEKLTRRLRENLGVYTKDLHGAREEMRQLVAEKERLVAVGSSGKYESPGAGMVRLNRIKEIEGDIAGREGEMAGRNKLDRRLHPTLRTGSEATDAISTYGVAAVGGGGKAALGKGLAIGAALLGGMSIMGFISDSMAKSYAFGGTDADLQRRGAGDLRTNAGRYGYTPMEHLGIADALNHTGNLRGAGLDSALETVKAFSRGRGFDADNTANYMGTMGAYTGRGGKELTAGMEKLRGAIVKSDAGGRGEEFMNRNLQLLSRIAEGRGGAIDGKGADFITALQAAFWAGGSPVGKGQSGQNMVGAMDEMIRSGGGGSHGAQLMMWQALGGDNIRTSEDYWKYKERLGEGAGNPDNVSAFYNYAKKLYGDDPAMLKVALSSMMPGLAPAQINEITRMGENGTLGSPGGYLRASGSISGDADAAGKLQGNQNRATVAGIENVKLGLGDMALPIANKAKGGLTLLGERGLKSMQTLLGDDSGRGPGLFDFLKPPTGANGEPIDGGKQNGYYLKTSWLKLGRSKHFRDDQAEGGGPIDPSGTERNAEPSALDEHIRSGTPIKVQIVNPVPAETLPVPAASGW
jgi:hypothetical protein